MVQDDFHDLHQIFTDECVMAAFHRGPLTEGEMRQWLDRNLHHQEVHGFGLFSVIERDSGQLVGDAASK